jgi:hypothetical protein
MHCGWVMILTFSMFRSLWDTQRLLSVWPLYPLVPLCRSRVFTPNAPFYRWGKTEYLQRPYHVNASFRLIETEPASLVGESETTWVLPTRLQHPVRNHESIVLEQGNGRYHLLQLLGRHSRVIQWMDLMTGQQGSRTTWGSDPAGYPLNDLNHVYAVVVDSLDSAASKEAWLVCGFRGDQVNREQSIQYARIIDLTDMVVRVGPKLATAGGACVALALEIDGPGTPPHICAFGGTDGNHNTGKFISETACYDRVQKRWHFVLGKLPYGMDHGNGAVIPAGTCQANDPARILLLNFRTSSFGEQRPEILALDLPHSGWTTLQVQQSIARRHRDTGGFNSSGMMAGSPWYLYANYSYAPYHPYRSNTAMDDWNRARDAAGLVIANGGRYLLNFAGVSYRYPSENEQTADQLPPKVTRKTSQVRRLDGWPLRVPKLPHMRGPSFSVR